MPEYETLLNDHCAFICDFEKEAIQKQVETILSMAREDIAQRSRRLQRRVFEQRNYEKMSERLIRFLRRQVD
jgi:hypothetical protein